MAFLELEGLTKTYGKGLRAVDDLSLRVERGEFIVLVGSSGCGKSTTLRLIAGLEEASAGTVRIAGTDVTRAQPADRNVAMVFQDFALYPHMSVFDNIAFPLRVRKVPKAKRETRVRAVADMLGIGDLLDRKPPKLSGGQKQRVAIAGALAANRDLVVFDEPTSGLDRRHMLETANTLRDLAARGVTSLVVTHDPELIDACCTWIVSFEDGEAVWSQPLDAACAERLRSFFG